MIETRGVCEDVLHSDSDLLDLLETITRREEYKKDSHVDKSLKELTRIFNAGKPIILFKYDNIDQTIMIRRGDAYRIYKNKDTGTINDRKLTSVKRFIVVNYNMSYLIDEYLISIGADKKVYLYDKPTYKSIIEANEEILRGVADLNDEMRVLGTLML